MNTEDRFALPPNLGMLAERYAGKTQGGVRFRLPSWQAALESVPGDPLRFLSDTASTSEPDDPHFRALGDRVVTRDAVNDVCQSLDLADNDAVVAAFVLVMAWGSGTSNSRSLRNTKAALQDVQLAAAILRDSAVTLRSVQDMSDAKLVDAHRRFSLPGVGEAFFTKWFAFAGFTASRVWQPLILERRVRATLHKTLDVWLNKLSEKRRDPERYAAYLAAMHRWAGELPQPMTATQLKWILFTHNGRPAYLAHAVEVSTQSVSVVK